MKQRASFTFDKKTVKFLERLVNSGKFRNRSHAVEYAIENLSQESKAEKNRSEEKSQDEKKEVFKIKKFLSDYKE